MKIVLSTSDEAAKYETRTLTGWWSRNGLFCGEMEGNARYDGCTHRPCSECGEPVQKYYVVCEECREKKKRERYDSFPKKKHEEGMLYSMLTNEYYHSIEYVEDDIDEYDLKLEDMMLLHTKPLVFHEIDTDVWEEDIPEDYEFTDEMHKIIEEFNEKLGKIPSPGWESINVAVDLEASGYV